MNYERLIVFATEILKGVNPDYIEDVAHELYIRTRTCDEIYPGIVHQVYRELQLKEEYLEDLNEDLSVDYLFTELVYNDFSSGLTKEEARFLRKRYKENVWYANGKNGLRLVGGSCTDSTERSIREKWLAYDKCTCG